MKNLSLSFSATADKPIAGLPKRFTGIAYNGDVIKYGAIGECVIDLATIRLGKAVVLLHHDQEKRIGVANLALVGNQITVSGEFTDSPLAMDVRKEFTLGLPFELSLGVTSDLERPTKPTLVNGKSVITTVLRNAKARELSLVSCGAADNTSVIAFSISEPIRLTTEQLLFNQVAFNSQSGERSQVTLEDADGMTTARLEALDSGQMERFLLAQVSGRT